MHYYIVKQIKKDHEGHVRNPARSDDEHDYIIKENCQAVALPRS